MARRTPIHLPEDLKAIAIDTNATGRDFQLGRIQELSDLLEEQELSAEVWIPEPVVWEWAEHIHARLVDVSSEIVRLNKTGLPALVELGNPVDQSVHLVLQALETALSKIEAVRILRLEASPDAAIEGLRDQVLQTGAGRRKEASRSKTGAADSASLRLIVSEAGNDLGESVALVSGDSDVTRHFGAESGPILIRDWGLLRLSVLAAVPSEQELGEQIANAIREHLEETRASQQLEYEAPEVKGDPARTDEIPQGGQRRIRFHGLQRLGVARVEEFSRKEGYASASAPVTVSLEVETVWTDPYGGQIEQDSTVYSDIPALLDLWVTRDSSDWYVTIESVVVPDEGSDEQASIVQALESSAEVQQAPDEPTFSGSRPWPPARWLSQGRPKR